jgi:hypothetical protein
LDGGKSPLYEEVKELRMVEIPHFGWFQIRDVVEELDGLRTVKKCVAYSAEVILQNKQVLDIEGEYKIYSPITPNESLLGLLLPKIPGWKIGNVDGTLLTRQRTVSISKQNLYALLVDDLAKIYECVFVFDYQNYLIHIVDVSKEFPKTSIYLSFHNLLKNASVTTKTDKVITALTVKGGDELDIAGVNPNGTDTIYNVAYYKNRMSPELLSALNAYENKYASLQASYAALLLSSKNKNQELTVLKSNSPAYDVSFTSSSDGTCNVTPAISSASGLSELEALRKALENVRAARIEFGNIPYTDVNRFINQVEPMISAKKSAITVKENEISTVSGQITGIVNQLKMENNFTEAQWVELNQYFYYDTLQEDSFIWTDVMAQQEKQDIQQELYDFGTRALARSSFPRFDIDIDSVNFLALPEFEYFRNQFVLGSTFTLDLGYYKVNPLLLEVQLDFNDVTNFKLIYSTKTMLDDGFDMLDYAGDSVNATNTISFDLVKLEAMKRQSNEISSFINGALDASKNELISSPNRTAITIDENGLRARSYDWTTGLPNGLSCWVTGSQIAFSKDNFQNSSLALGRILVPGNSGGYVYGIINEKVAVKTLKLGVVV